MKLRIKLCIVIAMSINLAGCSPQQRATPVNVQTENLFRATREGNVDMVKALLSSPGADVNATDERGSTPLLEAARFGHDHVALVLIAAGANLKTKDNGGKTALMLALQGNHDEVVRVLKEAGESE